MSQINVGSSADPYVVNWNAMHPNNPIEQFRSATGGMGYRYINSPAGVTPSGTAGGSPTATPPAPTATTGTNGGAPTGGATTARPYTPPAQPAQSAAGTFMQGASQALPVAAAIGTAAPVVDGLMSGGVNGANQAFAGELGSINNSGPANFLAGNSEAGSPLTINPDTGTYASGIDQGTGTSGMLGSNGNLAGIDGLTPGVALGGLGAGLSLYNFAENPTPSSGLSALGSGLGLAGSIFPDLAIAGLGLGPIGLGIGAIGALSSLFGNHHPEHPTGASTRTVDAAGNSTGDPTLETTDKGNAGPTDDFLNKQMLPDLQKWAAAGGYDLTGDQFGAVNNAGTPGLKFQQAGPGHGTLVNWYNNNDPNGYQNTLGSIEQAVAATQPNAKPPTSGGIATPPATS